MSKPYPWPALTTPLYKKGPKVTHYNESIHYTTIDPVMIRVIRLFFPKKALNILG